MASKRGIRRRERQRACVGKVQHASMKCALIARTAGGPDYRQCWAYKCKYCQMWHLGHPKQEWKQARLRRINEKY